MRIAIFTDSFLPGVGGTEKAVLGLASALKNNGNEVLVACPKYKNYNDKDFNFPVARAKSIKLTDNDYLALPFISYNFKKQIESFKPELIHCQSISGMTSYALKYAKRYKIPVYITVHTKFKTAFERSIKLKFIVNLLIKDMMKKLNKCDKVFTVSKDMAEELKTYGYNKNSIVIKNGTTFTKQKNLDELKNLARDKYNLSDNEFKFLF